MKVVRRGSSPGALIASRVHWGGSGPPRLGGLEQRPSGLRSHATGGSRASSGRSPREDSRKRSLLTYRLGERERDRGRKRHRLQAKCSTLSTCSHSTQPHGPHGAGTRSPGPGSSSEHWTLAPGFPTALHPSASGTGRKPEKKWLPAITFSESFRGNCPTNTKLLPPMPGVATLLVSNQFSIDATQ